MLFVNQGSLFGIGHVGNTATLAFSNQGNLTDAAGQASIEQISGVVTLRFGAEPSPAGVLSGIGTVSFANSSLLSASGVLAGISRYGFSNEVDINGILPLAGTASFAFTNEAVFFSRAYGISDLAFSNASDIEANFYVVEDIQITFANSGTLTDALVSLSGTAAVTFSNVGLLGLLAGSPIAGTAAANFTGLAAVSAIGSLAGQAVQTFENRAQGTAAGTIQLSGTSAMVFHLEAEPLRPRDVGAGRKRRRRRRYIIEIDGQDFDVSSPEEAVELLERAKQIAAEKAAKDLLVYSKKIRRKRVPRPATAADLPLPSISTKHPEISEIVDQARKAIDLIYLNAARDAELRELIRRKILDEEREEEAILLLIA